MSSSSWRSCPRPSSPCRRRRNLGEVEPQVLEALAIASAAQLDPDRPQDPYKLATQFGGKWPEVPGDPSGSSFGPGAHRLSSSR